MTDSRPYAASLPRQPGRFVKALTRMFMKRATVATCESVGEGFRLITFESAAFEGVAWTPGQKVQIALGGAFVSRTYTPMEWDAAAGRTRILAYAHGSGPGSDWIRSVKQGDECDIFGPRASLDVGRLAGPVVVFGDETSFGLAFATARHDPARSVQCLLEVNSVENAQHVLAPLGLRETQLFARQRDEAQLEDIERRLPALAATGATFVLTGKATSIRRLRQALKGVGVPAGRVVTRAYWAPGKAGLD